MKKFFAMFAAFVVAVSANLCSAMESVTELKYIVGNWYDTKGNLVLTISNDYKINGCVVLSVDAASDTASIYKVVINEGNQLKTIELMSTGSYAAYSEHKMLVMNWRSDNGYVLRRTQEPYYFESVGGIYLGMDQNQVVARYGQPSSVENNRRSSTWTYNREGFSVTLEYGVVCDITIYSYGNRGFDRSGLSANSSRADFGYKYNTSVSSRGSLNIGHGEVISVGDGKVSLRFLTSGYVL